MSGFNDSLGFSMDFLALLWWEFVQNLPLIFGFSAGFSLWQHSVLAAVGCMVMSSVIAALLIAATEARIFHGHRESVRAVITNVVTFSVMMFVFAVYLSASWSGWWTDIAAGLVAGIVLAAVQDRAANERFALVRSLALGLSCSVSVIVIRLVGGLWGAVTATLWFTLVMGVYKQLWQKSRQLDTT
jgi:hypothetical protein